MEPTDKKEKNRFSKQIGEKEKRKVKALRENKSSVWFGIGMFGMVGWSVAVPTLLGAALGTWLDKNYHQSFSWTLTCLLIGLITGIIIGWFWVAKEEKEMHQKTDEDDK